MVSKVYFRPQSNRSDIEERLLPMKALFCNECGWALDEKGFCQNPQCTNHETEKAKPFDMKAFREKGKLIVPDCVQSDQDEVPIKQYDIARLQTLIKGAFAEGRLQVTNKRVLFRSAGYSILGPTSLQYEFSLEEIAGVEIRKEARFNFFASVLYALFTCLIYWVLDPIFTAIYSWGFISSVFSILMAAASVFLFVFFRNKKVLRHLALSVPFVWFAMDMSITHILPDDGLISMAFFVTLLAYIISLLVLAFAPNLVLNIKTKGGTPSMEIRRKDGFFSFQHNEYTGFAQVIPGPDTDTAMKEIGALIREVQQTGGYTEM